VAIQNILSLLINRDKVNPGTSYYEALILSNCHPELGSVENVKSILEEMGREEIPIAPSISFAIIKVC
jgi:hypothetical protein